MTLRLASFFTLALALSLSLALAMGMAPSAFGAELPSAQLPSAALPLTELQDLKSCELLLAGSDDQVYRAFFQNYADNWQDGLGQRGFMGGAIPETALTNSLAMEYGLIWWGMKFNFASTIQEAIEHRLKQRNLHEIKGTEFSDIIVSGLYFIGSESDLGLTFTVPKVKTPSEVNEGNPKQENSEVQNEDIPENIPEDISEDIPEDIPEDKSVNELPVPPETVRRLISKGAYEVDYLGNATFVTPEQLRRRVSENDLNYHRVGHIPGAFGKNSMSQGGWVAFKQHGMHDYSQWKTSGTAKELRKLAIKLFAKGWTFRFNTDYRLMLDKIRDQKRSLQNFQPDENGKMVKVGRLDQEPHQNRYLKEETYNSALGVLEAGKGYSVGLYDETGKLRGGEIGFRSGNHLYGDSIFYDEVVYAKLATLALFDVLDAAGMPYSDPGMITAYSASLGAQLMPFPEWRAKIKSGPKELIEMPEAWDPRLPVDYKAVMSEIAKRRNQAIGHVKLTRRLPELNDVAQAAAQEFGLEQVSLNLRFVSTLAEASLDASKRSTDQLPIYIVGEGFKDLQLSDKRSEEPSEEPSALNFLRQNLGQQLTVLSPLKVYFIGSARHPEIAKEIPLQQLLNVLELKSDENPPQWTSHQSMSVSGWGFAKIQK